LIMLKQKAILKAVISLLKIQYEATKFYTDEIIEGYKQPCFFVKMIKQRSTETKNTNSNSLSIALTYFADTAANKQLAFLDVEDTVGELFGNGFNAGARYLHVKSIAAERIGENRDILQMIIDTDYFDSTGYDGDAGYDLMQELNVNIK